MEAERSIDKEMERQQSDSAKLTVVKPLKAFEKAKNQIGFCGIWCGSCVVGNGALIEFTKRYEEIIKRYGLEEWGPKDFDFEELLRGLTSIQGVPLRKGCLRVGGGKNCEMRICASKRNILACSECDQPSACKKIETLRRMRTGARKANLLVETENVNREEGTERWTTELRIRLPHCIVFEHG